VLRDTDGTSYDDALPVTHQRQPSSPSVPPPPPSPSSSSSRLRSIVMSTAVCVLVCLSVRLHNSKTAPPNFTKFCACCPLPRLGPHLTTIHGRSAVQSIMILYTVYIHCIEQCNQNSKQFHRLSTSDRLAPEIVSWFPVSAEQVDDVNTPGSGWHVIGGNPPS